MVVQRKHHITQRQSTKYPNPCLRRDMEELSKFNIPELYERMAAHYCTFLASSRLVRGLIPDAITSADTSGTAPIARDPLCCHTQNGWWPGLPRLGASLCAVLHENMEISRKMCTGSQETVCITLHALLAISSTSSCQLSHNSTMQ